MNAGRVLLTMVMLGWVAGCSPAPDRRASDKGTQQAARSTPLAPAAPGLRASDDISSPDSSARVAILPAIDPAVAARSAVPADSGQVIVANRMLPMKPLDANIPPTAYVADLPPSNNASDPTPFPDEVTRYMVDRDGCDHFRGEEAYDAERAAYLQESVAELCNGTDARLAVLRQRYARDPAVMSALSGYEERIEGNASQ